jgi:putative transposase
MREAVTTCKVAIPFLPYDVYQLPLERVWECNEGNWHQIYVALRVAERERVGRNAQPSAAIMDSQSVKTVEESATISGFDAHKHIKGCKRHLLVDTLRC